MTNRESLKLEGSLGLFYGAMLRDGWKPEEIDYLLDLPWQADEYCRWQEEEHGKNEH